MKHPSDITLAEHLQRPHMRLFARLVDSGKRADPAALEVPVAFYLDEAWCQKEMRELFPKHPIMIGHVSSIPDPGDHFIHDDLGAPLLVVRGADREVRVFYNVCRHRGMRLVNEEGVRRRPGFVCPYHHWTYDLDGSLKNAPLPEVFCEGALQGRALKQVPTDIYGGFIWVQLKGAQTINAAAHLDDLADDFDAFNVTDHVVFRQSVCVKKANWKLIVDAFQDSYHVVRLHQKSIGPFFEDAWADAERRGRNIRAVVAREGFTDVRSLPPEQWDPRLHVTFAHYIFPNTIMIFHPDYISQLSLFPLGVDETRVIHTCLVPEQPETEAEKAHWERAFDIIENGVFQAEDFFVCEGAQKGMASGANESLLLGGHETSVAMFHDILFEELGPFRANRQEFPG